MAEIIHPDSDWARLGSAFLDRKPFKRLTQPTPEQAAANVLQPYRATKKANAFQQWNTRSQTNQPAKAD
jgi:hypothetical protein